MKKIKSWLYDRLSHIVLIIAWLGAYYIFRIRNKVKIIGRENLFHSTNILYVSNHLTWIDSFLIGISVMSFWETLFFPEHISWNAPDRKNFLTHKVWKHLFILLKNIPVDRDLGGRNAVTHIIRLFTEVLHKSNLVLFFEGTRSRTGEIGSCVSGVSEAIRVSQPRYVIPIFLDQGVGSIMPIKDGPRLGAIRSGQKGQIIIGSPIDFSDIDMSGRFGRVREQIGQRVRQSVVNLSTRVV